MRLKNPIQKGRNQQRKARKALELAGYYVEVARFSRWGNTDFWNLFDIIAILPYTNQVRLIQVKSNRFLNPLERELIEQFKVGDCIIKEVWRYNDREKEPIIKILK